VEQVAVGRVELHDIEADIDGSDGGVDEGVPDAFDTLGVEPFGL